MEELDTLLKWFEKNTGIVRFHPVTYYQIHTGYDIISQLTKLSSEIQQDFPFYAKRIDELKNRLFMENMYINPGIFGRISEILLILKENIEQNEHIQWKYIHHEFYGDTKKKFQYGFYTDAVFTATGILMKKLKEIYKNSGLQQTDLDGAAIIEKLLQKENPIIIFSGIKSRTEKNIQKGYEHLFKGWIHAIRNPKAHDINNPMTEIEAFQELVIISILMKALDESILVPSDATEKATELPLDGTERIPQP